MGQASSTGAAGSAKSSMAWFKKITPSYGLSAPIAVQYYDQRHGGMRNGHMMLTDARLTANQSAFGPRKCPLLVVSSDGGADSLLVTPMNVASIEWLAPVDEGKHNPNKPIGLAIRIISPDTTAQQQDFPSVTGALPQDQPVNTWTLLVMLHASDPATSRQIATEICGAFERFWSKGRSAPAAASAPASSSGAGTEPIDTDDESVNYDKEGRDPDYTDLSREVTRIIRLLGMSNGARLGLSRKDFKRAFLRQIVEAVTAERKRLEASMEAKTGGSDPASMSQSQDRPEDVAGRLIDTVSSPLSAATVARQMAADAKGPPSLKGSSDAGRTRDGPSSRPSRMMGSDFLLSPSSRSDATASTVGRLRQVAYAGSSDGKYGQQAGQFAQVRQPCNQLMTVPGPMLVQQANGPAGMTTSSHHSGAGYGQRPAFVPMAQPAVVWVPIGAGQAAAMYSPHAGDPQQFMQPAYGWPGGMSPQAGAGFVPMSMEGAGQ